MKTLAETTRRIRLADGGRTSYQIVVSADASLSVLHAAEELRNFLGKISGADFVLRTDASPRTDREILVGRSSRLDDIAPDIDWSRLGKEGFTLRTVGDTVVIAGSDVRGALYGVYTFLEDYCGCRFFAEEVVKIPRRDVLTIPAIEDDTQIPALEYRESYFNGYSGGDLYARWKTNGHFGNLTEIHGGKMKYCHFVHSFTSLVPPSKYFEEHPEYYSEIDGKRTIGSWGNTQLCLTNPEVLAIVIERVRTLLRENPDIAILSVSQDDNQDYCRCEKCRALDEYEGSHAGTLLHFVNVVADAVKDEFPDVAIDTLAYQYTRKPPLHVKPRPNVIIRLCSIECCFSHPLEVCDDSFKRDIIEWSKIAGRLHIWDYVVNFAHALSPFPNFKVLQPNIKFFIEHSVTGIFEEGYNSPRPYAELNPLRQYILAKLLWNPDYDVETGINEFLTGYYGQAAAEIRNYFDLIHAQITPDTHMRIYDKPHQPYLSAEMCAATDKIFDRAEALADDDDVLARVRKLRLSVRYVEVVNIPMDDPTRDAVMEEFFADVRELGICSYNEGGNIENREAAIREGKV